MSIATVPLLAGALLLLVSGVSKLRSPRSTVEAARSGGLPVGEAGVRVLGGVEVLVGVGALAGVPGGAGALALLYLGFAAFVARGLVRGDLETCGCFAGDRSAPSWLHVVVDGLVAVAGGVVAVEGGASLPDVLAADDAVGLLLLSATAAALTWVVLSRLPERGEVPARLLDGDAA